MILFGTKLSTTTFSFVTVITHLRQKNRVLKLEEIKIILETKICVTDNLVKFILIFWLQNSVVADN